ncbi:hypothetical protein LWI28_004729 [Acer negundo]|uniref:Uncharacterized protein n=1 Tax=Acer negundo TaxID=4023 RepID=A0AAD5NTR3_ACENE|nr:hypothetical protein LWI28_004729 [Acer negundo]KAK4847437.1 hypothetical protein QYF36_001907 [Acer negundo]
MGNCASPQYTNKNKNGGGNSKNMMMIKFWQSTAKIIRMDGRLQEIRQPIKAGDVISQNPKTFLCSSESMYVDSVLPHVPEDEELQLGQIYFLMPLSKSHVPLTLQELCSLAIKASSALSDNHLITTTNWVSYRTPSSQPQACREVPVGFSTQVSTRRI